MRGIKKVAICAFLIVMLFGCFSQPVYAITESDVQKKVEEVGKDAVTGSVLVWFLCAIAFLKISQKIDSFMASLGINVGHTGGSMLAEALIAARGIGLARSFSGQSFGGAHGRAATNGGSGSQASFQQQTRLSVLLARNIWQIGDLHIIMPRQL